MSRLVNLTLVAWVCGLLLVVPTAIQAQSNESSPLATPTATPLDATPSVGIAAAAANATLTATATTTASVPTLDATTPLALPTATPQPGTGTQSDAPLEGTILTNRSRLSARFFLEGETYLLQAGAAIGVRLPRQTSVLNLYNCDAQAAESQACFWDPYLVQSEGLYEVFDAPAQDGVAKLLLREAGAPPTDQVWIQNRTGKPESVVFRNEVFELAATGLLEFPVAAGAPAILYVRHCLTLDGQSVCEWMPKTLEAGTYYALVDNSISGVDAGSTITTVDLRPIVGGDVVETDTSTADFTPPANQVTCRLAVPVLNVRSGPGLQYNIIGKIRSDGTTPASVAVTGRSVDSLWLTVEPAVARDGWITSSANFVTCDATLGNLPMVEAPPLPEPAVVTSVPLVTVAPAEQTEQQNGGDAQPEPEAAEEAAGEEPAMPSIPPGQGLLLVNNGFQHEIRVTIDQRYRTFEGPSEYDLQPGGSTNIVVFPGKVAITVSSAWNGLSRNAELDVSPDATKTLWLRFERDSGDSWYLLWE